MSCFIRQKTIQIPDSRFKIAKLYACTEETDIGRKSSDEFKAIVMGNFAEDDFIITLPFADSAEDKNNRAKELSRFLSQLAWANHSALSYVHSGNSYDDRFVVVLQRNGADIDKMNELASKLWNKGNATVQYIEKDEKTGLPQLPKLTDWCCSSKIEQPVITVEDEIITVEDYETFLKAKVGEDVSPIIHKMFGDWTLGSARIDVTDNGVELVLFPDEDKEVTVRKAKSSHQQER